MIVKELFEKVSFEEIMSYLFNERQIIHDIEDLEEKTEDEIVEECRLMKEAYHHAYNQLIKIKPQENKSKVLIMLKETDLFNESYYDISCFDYNELLNDNIPEIYAIDFIPWEEILGYQVSLANLKEYSFVQLVGEVLWELTFYGYDEEVIGEEKEELLTRKQEVDEAIKNEDFSKFHTIKDVFTELGFVDERTEEENKEKLDMEELLKLNKKNRFNLFKKEKELKDEIGTNK